MNKIFVASDGRRWHPYGITGWYWNYESGDMIPCLSSLDEKGRLLVYEQFSKLLTPK